LGAIHRLYDPRANLYICISYRI